MSILFKGDNKALISSINALLALDAKGALSPPGIGEMARDLLESCAARLLAEQHQGEPVALPARKDPTEAWAVPGGVHKAEGWNACLDEIAKLGPLYSRPVQGEPVAWSCAAVKDDDTSYARLAGSEAEAREFLEHYQGIGAVVTIMPLYTHADPGEVERLRKEVAELEQLRRDDLGRHLITEVKTESQLAECEAMAAMIAEREWAEHAGTGPVSSKVEAAFTQLHNDLHEASDKLAERDALLRDKSGDLIRMAAHLISAPLLALQELQDEDKKMTRARVDHAVDVADARLKDAAYELRRIADALSASAEPSAPKCKACGDTGTIDDTSKDALPDGLYVERGLVACTACEGLDEPTDLATWKRRAIEAESKLRTYDPQVVELGERAMQALLAEPTPKELVLTRCKLCDQLQADLTERDEEVDRLRAAIAKARKTICLPKSIESLLDSAMEQRP